MNSQSLKDYIVLKSKELEFHEIGFTSPQIEEAWIDAYHQWIQNKYHGQMHYMQNSLVKRLDPSQVLEGAKTVVVLATNYFEKNQISPDKKCGKIAQYAFGKDYHLVIEKKLKDLVRSINEFNPQIKVKSYVDTGPVLEKYFAQKTKVGFMGKNSLIINPNYGSWIFLSVLLLDVSIDIDMPYQGSCANCTLCIQACPTGALSPYTVDSNKCISYLTIESKDEQFDSDIEKNMSPWFFGCDICQEVCPLNKREKETNWVSLKRDSGVGQWIDLIKIANMDVMTYQETFRQTPLKRPKIHGLKRNANRLLSQIK